MKLFSKRNTRPNVNTLDERRYSGVRTRRTELLSLEARNRLIAEIKFLSSRNDFLEWFILFENGRKETIFFDKGKIDSFSLAELGYAMSDNFEFENFKMVEIERKIRYATNDERSEKYFDDFKLFDLAEITILFAKSRERPNVIKRFNTIFDEENTDFQIIEHLITKRSGETLRSLKNILKDDNLRIKISSFLEFETSGDYINSAKISSDLVNLIFSGYIKDNKPKEIKALKIKLINKLLNSDDESDEKHIRLDKYIDSLLKTAKELSNDIYDVRHTEKSTLVISNDNIYKLISSHNMSIVELVLTTLKDDYVLSNDWETIKKEYIEKYKIDPNTRLTISKPIPDDVPIDLSEIPF
jgi:hypothetical protein